MLRLERRVRLLEAVEIIQAMGAPELGFLLTCSGDFGLAEGYGGDVQLTRTQTIMQGASHCDFRYALKKKPWA